MGSARRVRRSRLERQKVNVYATTPRSRVQSEPAHLGGWCKKLVCQKEVRRAVDVKGLLFHDDTLESFFHWPGRPRGGFSRSPRGVAQGGGRREAGARARGTRRLPLPARQVREAGDSSSVRRPRLRSLLPRVCTEGRAWSAAHPGAGNGGAGGLRHDETTAARAEPAVDAAQQPDGEAIPGDGGAAPEAAADAGVTVEPAPDFDLPYRVVFAVCTTDTAPSTTPARTPPWRSSRVCTTPPSPTPRGPRAALKLGGELQLAPAYCSVLTFQHLSGAGTRSRRRRAAHIALALFPSGGCVRGGEGEARGGGGEGGCSRGPPPPIWRQGRAGGPARGRRAAAATAADRRDRTPGGDRRLPSSWASEEQRREGGRVPVPQKQKRREATPRKHRCTGGEEAANRVERPAADPSESRRGGAPRQHAHCVLFTAGGVGDRRGRARRKHARTRDEHPANAASPPARKTSASGSLPRAPTVRRAADRGDK